MVQIQDHYHDIDLAIAAQKWHDASQLCRKAEESHPEDAGLRARQGIIALRSGNIGGAIPLLKEAIQLDSKVPAAHTALAVALLRAQQTGVSLHAARQAIQNDPNDAEAHAVLGRGYLAQFKFDRAALALDDAVRLDPTNSAAWHNLAVARQKMGNYEDAEAAFQAAIKTAPTSPQPLLGLAQLHHHTGNLLRADEYYDRAVALVGNSAEALVGLASTIANEDNPERAYAVLDQALAIDPTVAGGQALRGQLLQQMGRFDDAQAALLAAIAQRPNHVTAYFDFVNGGRMSSADRAMIEQMASLLSDRRLSIDDRANIHYGLGKAFDDLGEYGRAIQHFHEANGVMRMKLGANAFNHELHRAGLEGTMRAITRETLANAQPASLTDKPVLIVGMIRSGSTLIEQILASHPDVAAGGELTYLLERTSDALGPDGQPDPERAKAFAEGYLNLLESIGPGKKHVTDKMPHNFSLTGFVHSILPNVRIIHCRRKAIDNCLSVYLTPYRGAVNFAHRPEDVVFFYQQYLRVMQHWREILPADRFLEVDYEALVDDTEGVSRRIVDFVGLEWNDACLQHYKNAATIKTPSRWQARQPIYRTSVDRWRNYEPWLGAFRELLDTKS